MLYSIYASSKVKQSYDVLDVIYEGESESNLAFGSIVWSM